MKIAINLIFIIAISILQQSNCNAQDKLVTDNLKTGDTLMIDAINSSDRQNTDFGDRLLVFKSDTIYYCILLDNFYDLTFIDGKKVDKNEKWHLFLTGKLKYKKEIMTKTQIEKIKDLERKVNDKKTVIENNLKIAGTYLTITFKIKNKIIIQNQETGGFFRLTEFLK